MKFQKPPKGVLSDEMLEAISGKLVECVREVRPPIMPTSVLWSGETIDGYFQAAFIGGVVVLLWDERENVLKFGLKDGVYIGISDRAVNLMEKDEEDTVKNLNDIEILKKMAEDVKNTQFSDIMELVQWKYKNENVKVESQELSLS